MSAERDYPAVDTAGGVEMLQDQYWAMIAEIDRLRAGEERSEMALIEADDNERREWNRRNGIPWRETQAGM